MVNLKLLNERIEASGLKTSFFLEQLGISRVVWHYRLTGKSDFKNSEMIKLKRILNLSEEEFEAIFFSLNVD